MLTWLDVAPWMTARGEVHSSNVARFLGGARGRIGWLCPNHAKRKAFLRFMGLLVLQALSQNPIQRYTLHSVPFAGQFAIVCCVPRGHRLCSVPRRWGMTLSHVACLEWAWIHGYQLSTSGPYSYPSFTARRFSHQWGIGDFDCRGRQLCDHVQGHFITAS